MDTIDAQPCLELLREIKSASFATVDAHGRPQVRIIDVMLVRMDAVYFLTARGKDFYAELVRAGRVAVTALSRDWRMVRLDGSVRHVTDKSWLDEIFVHNPSMNDMYPGKSRDILEVFCISSGSGELFDLGSHPVKRASFAFGGAEIVQKGYVITGACLACGACAAVCPQACIDEGEPYTIRRHNCLHCGLCHETCPNDAIDRLP